MYQHLKLQLIVPGAAGVKARDTTWALTPIAYLGAHRPGGQATRPSLAAVTAPTSPENQDQKANVNAWTSHNILDDKIYSHLPHP